MIFSVITQSGTKIDTLNNTIYQYSDNLTFQFLRDAKFNEYTLGAYINYDDKIYGLEVSEDDTFKVDSRFLDDEKEFLLSFSLTSGEEIIHLGTIKYSVKEAFGSITSPLPKPKEIWESFVQEKVDSYFLENYQSKLDEFNSKKTDFDEKYQEVLSAESNTKSNLEKAKKIKEDIDTSKNEIDEKIGAFDKKTNEFDTNIENFNAEFDKKKEQIENDKTEIDKKVSDFNQNVATSKKSIDDQTTSAVELINKTKEQSLNELSETKETIDNDISSKQKDIDGLVENSKKEINDLADNSLENIENKKKSSVEAIDTSKTNALNDVNQSKNKAIKEVEEAGAHYQEQIDDLQKESAAQSVTLENLEDKVELKVNSPYINNKNETHITNSDNGLVDNLIIEGNTYQETTKGYNLFNKEQVKENMSTNELLNNGSTSYSVNYATTDFIPITVGKYVISNKYWIANICFYDIDKSIISNAKNPMKNYIQINVPENAAYCRMSFLKNGSVTSDKVMQEIVESIMLEEGSTAHNYEPYTGGQPSPSPDYPQEVKGVSEISGKIVGKNLFDIAQFLKDCAQTLNADGTITLKTNNGKYYLNLPQNDNIYFEYIVVNNSPSGRANMQLFYKDGTSVYLASEVADKNTIRSIKLTKEVDYIIVLGWTNITVKDLKIVIGTTVTDYQPYQSQSFNYTLSKPLYRLSDSVYDYIDVDKGKIVRNVRYKDFVGAENEKYITSNSYKGWYTNINDAKKGSSLLCSLYRQVPYVAYNQIGLSFTDDNNLKIVLGLDIYNEFLDDSINNYIKDHPFRVYYQLATPTEEPLPSDLQTLLQSLKSYYPQTNIMFDTEVEPYINFDYKLNLKSWIEDKDNKEIIYDKQNKEKDKYSSTFFENMFALQRTGEIYTVKFPKWETSHISTGEKLDANAGLVCEPSTKTIKGQNDYANIPLFKTYDVNAYVDDDGVRHVTAIKGDKDFKDKGKVDVFVLGMSYYEKVWEDEQYWYYSRTDSPREGYTIARECINRDGSIQPFALYAKYVSGFIDKVPYSSKGLIPGRVYSSTPLPSEDSFSANNSYTNMITNYHKKGNFYCGGMTCDYKYILSTFYLKYATLNTQSIMYGCANCNFQYKAAIQSEDKNTYFPVTKSQATQIEIGSSVSVGYQSKFSSTITVDRAYSNTHRYADDVKVLKKEDIDDNNVAIYLNITEPFNTMPVTVADGVESEIYISSMHWQSGFSDDVLDRDGCPCETKAQLVNGKFPMVIQGIEIMVGGYEIYGNAFMDIVDATGKREVYIQNDASLLTTNMTTAKTTYKKSPYAIQPTKLNSWNYITRIDFDLENGVFVQTGCGQESSGTGVGFADGIYVDSASSGQREFLALGNLRNGGNAGLSYLNANNGLGNANWNILSLISDLSNKFRSHTSVG